MPISEKCSKIVCILKFYKKPVLPSIALLERTSQSLATVWRKDFIPKQYSTFPANYKCLFFSRRSMKIIYGNRIPVNTASMSDVPVALSVSSLISQNMAPPSAC